MAENSSVKTLAIIGVLVAGAIVGGVMLTNNLGKTSYEISEEEAVTQMNKLLRNVNVTEVEARKATVDFSGTSLASSLPDIESYPLTVTGDGQVNIEIFASPEKSGTGTDGWLNEAAKQFNAMHERTESGKSMSVSIRNLSSGMASDYIVSGKYAPDAYTPSNSMWGTMAEASGAELSTENGTDRLVGNVAGILLSGDMV
ncbi:MAG: VWA domain-containing protein, partial [Oscillospiraceae bacterium]|nr:VWA domain-containing protein [Oscillospiraceae bacterium]